MNDPDYWTKKRQEVINNPNEKYIAPYAVAKVNETGKLIEENKVLKKYRLYVLQSVCEILDMVGATWWISDGTLLGYHRQGGMIDHDVDVDVSILEEDMFKVWEARNMLPPGLVMSCTDTVNKDFAWCTQRGSYPYDPNVPSAKKLVVTHTKLPTPEKDAIVWEAACDIYTYRKEKYAYMNNYSKGGQGIQDKIFPSGDMFPLVRTIFEDITVNVPFNTKKVLEINYGYIGENAYWDEKDKIYKKLN